jgi:hypothetical protein|eukprot:COSAG01_NODE_3191_length_6436_cov_14.338646_1_plen_169_part_00
MLAEGSLGSSLMSGPRGDGTAAFPASADAVLPSPAGGGSGHGGGGGGGCMYADEFLCQEPDTRQWRHTWCKQQNSGQLAQTPPILAAGEPLTVPQCLGNAARTYRDYPCMGTRQVLRVDDSQRTASGRPKILWHKTDTYACAPHPYPPAAARFFFTRLASPSGIVCPS